MSELFDLTHEERERTLLWVPQESSLGPDAYGCWMPVERLLRRPLDVEASLAQAPSSMVVVVRSEDPG